MKKTLLLGTTALIAAGVVSSGVVQAAEDPISVGVGGYVRSAMGFIDQNSADGQFANAANSMTIANDIEITISGSTTLDNGITAGVSFNIEGNADATAGSESLDERHAFFQGSFGQIKFGQIESARQEMTNFAPSGNYNFGVNTPFFIFGNPGNNGTTGIFNVRTYDDGLGIEDNLKLVYFSPTFNGFRIGASYSPGDSNGDQYGGNAGNALGGLQNNAAVAAEFSHNFGDFNIRLMAGYEAYTLETCNVNAAGVTTVASRATTTPASTATLANASDQNCENNPGSTQFGGSISFGEWSIGGGWLESDQVSNNAAGGGMERTDYDIGVSWWSGPFGVGLMYGSAEVDRAADNTTDEFTLYELNGTYVLGPGIDVGATIRRGDFDDGTAVGGLDNEFTEFAISAAMTF